MTEKDQGGDWLQLNRSNWDERVPHHVNGSFYDIDAFINGELTITERQIDDLSPVAGKDLVHLQCHFGLDTLSWARLGANVTGLDFSDAAIVEAKKLAAKTGLAARFEVGNVYEAPRILSRQFDIVYTGIGALCWLPDISGWAKVVADLMRPGGELYLIEFHPTEWIFSDDGEAVEYDYFTEADGLKIVQAGSYADPDASTQHNETRQWNHNLGDVITALVHAGLTINEVRESADTMYQVWPFLVEKEKRLFTTPKNRPNRPMMYTIRAICPD